MERTVVFAFLAGIFAVSAPASGIGAPTANRSEDYSETGLKIAIEQTFLQSCGHGADPASASYYLGVIKEARMTVAEAQDAIRVSCVNRVADRACPPIAGLAAFCSGVNPN
jgi:hypothetical protein